MGSEREVYPDVPIDVCLLQCSVLPSHDIKAFFGLSLSASLFKNRYDSTVETENLLFTSEELSPDCCYRQDIMAVAISI